MLDLLSQAALKLINNNKEVFNKNWCIRLSLVFQFFHKLFVTLVKGSKKFLLYEWLFSKSSLNTYIVYC